jgi:hypothetical protein
MVISIKNGGKRSENYGKRGEVLVNFYISRDGKKTVCAVSYLSKQQILSMSNRMSSMMLLIDTVRILQYTVSEENTWQWTWTDKDGIFCYVPVPYFLVITGQSVTWCPYQCGRDSGLKIKKLFFELN